MPFIDLNLAMVKYITNNIQGDKRKVEAYIDIGLYYTNTDNLDITSFGKKIIDELQDKIRSNQCGFSGIDYITIENVRLQRETMAHQTIFHFIITVYCEYYDLS